MYYLYIFLIILAIILFISYILPILLPVVLIFIIVSYLIKTFFPKKESSQDQASTTSYSSPNSPKHDAIDVDYTEHDIEDE